MKKQLFLALVLIFAISSVLIAGTPRIYLQRCSLDTGGEAPVTNGATSTSPDYIIRATIVETGETIGTDLGTPATSIRISRAGTSPNFYTAVTVQLGTFPTQWVAGQTVSVFVQYIPNGETATWTQVIPAGTATINIQDPIKVIPPYTPTPTATYTVNMSTVPVGYITPTMLGPTTDPTTIYGTYTPTPLPAPATGYWTPAYLTIDASTVWTADGDNWVLNQEFVWTEVNTYMYNLYVTGPDGYAVTGPVAGVTDYVASNAVQANLLGMYTIAAAPAGFHWVVNPIEVTADGWALVTKKGAVAGTRSSTPKAHYVYEKTIEFALEADPTQTYTLNVNGPVGYHVTGPVSGDLPYQAIDNDNMTNELFGAYTVEPAPAGFHWVVNPIIVDADTFGANVTATIEFVLEADVPTYDYPQGVPVVITVGTIQVDGGNGNNVPAGVIPPVPNVAFVPSYSTVLELVGAGPWTVTFATTEPWGAWYSYTSGSWMMVPNIGGFITFVIPAGGKDVPLVPIVLGPVDPTLPVELSSFTAVLTAQNFVKLTWVSQSETEMLGYRVYRSESGDQANAVMITPSMIGATNTSTTQTYSITDNEVAIGSTYWYWLESVDYASSHFHGPVSIIVEGNVPPVLPEVTSLRNAYPNPFRMNSATNIEVAVKAGETGTVTIYNILGQAVKTFTVREGFHKINWNGRDAKGNVCGSGIYFYKLSTPSINQTKKMVIVK